ncbi:uncharacterized protein LOC113870147 [Abrus precatorius]|uniref:Uncharacterized protein LOC113870147 n=1 Tax=Abrus precatorius TaxID=3816 RepID=A0A8B8M4A1_ABRPR|nr:uncharacterized protein LOC113870147 [Abrus precatorius]
MEQENVGLGRVVSYVVTNAALYCSTTCAKSSMDATWLVLMGLLHSSQKNWRSMLTQLGGGTRSFATPTTPKLKPMSPTVDAAHHASTSSMSTLKAEFAPVYIVCGMVVVALTIGSHTAYQQLARSPSVHVNKKRRESMPEVYDPDRTIKSATKFIDGSFLRKMSYIQENKATLNDPVHPNPFTHPRTAETLKSVGIESRRR